MSTTTRFAAALGTAALLAGTTFLGVPATAQPADTGTGLSATGQKSIDDLGACLSGSKSADILVIMDESASLKEETEGGPATDPRNIREDAAKNLVTLLGRHAEDLNADINVKLAGFGDGYRADSGTYGSWTNVREDADGLDRQLSGISDRSSDGWTKYGDALSGALGEFSDAPTRDGKASGCQAVLFFTDGMITSDAGDTPDLVADI